MTVRIYVDTEVLQDALNAEASIATVEMSTVLDILYFTVYESASKGGAFVSICTVDYDPHKNYIEVPALVAPTALIPGVKGYADYTDWFKLSYTTAYNSIATVIDATLCSGTTIVSTTLVSVPILPGPLVSKDAGVTLSLQDNRNGTISGSAVTSFGTIDYYSGSVQFILAQVPAGVVTADYFYLTQESVESDLSDATLGEYIALIIAQVRTALGDIDLDAPAFEDDELILKLKNAVRRFKGSEGIYILKESEIEPIILLIRINCCYDLAYDNARYTALSLPDNIKLNKGQRVTHYLELAKALEAQYRSLLEDWGGSTDDNFLTGTPQFEQVSMSRSTYFIGGRLPVVDEYRKG